MIWNAWEPFYVLASLAAVAITSILCWTKVKLEKLSLESERMQYQHEIVTQTLEENPTKDS